MWLTQYSIDSAAATAPALMQLCKHYRDAVHVGQNGSTTDVSKELGAPSDWNSSLEALLTHKPGAGALCGGVE